MNFNWEVLINMCLVFHCVLSSFPTSGQQTFQKAYRVCHEGAVSPSG